MRIGIVRLGVDGRTRRTTVTPIDNRKTSSIYPDLRRGPNHQAAGFALEIAITQNDACAVASHRQAIVTFVVRDTAIAKCDIANAIGQWRRQINRLPARRIGSCYIQIDIIDQQVVHLVGNGTASLKIGQHGCQIVA